MLRWTWLPILTLGLCTAGCAEFVDEDEGQVSETEIPLDRRGTIPERQGFSNGAKVSFWRLGSFVPQDAPWFPRYDKFPGLPVGELFVFAGADGGPALGETGQWPIIDLLPQQAGATDFFEIVTVKPPAGYQANDIKSRSTLLDAGYSLTRTGIVVNCPVVGPAAELGGAAGSKQRKLRLWHRKKTVHCQLIGEDLPTQNTFQVYIASVGAERTVLRVAANEVYVFRASAFAAADQQTNIPVPGNDIFRHAPPAPEYSPLSRVWDVTVTTDYKVGQVSSYQALFPVPDFTDPNITPRSPDAFCNCPLAAGAPTK